MTSTSTSTIAVTGGTGFVGRAVIDRALEAGHRVRALTRRPHEGRAGIEWIAGDLGDRAALGRLAVGVQAVVHVAGLVSMPDPADFTAANVAGTRAILDAAAAAGVGRFVFVSSLSAREPALSAYGASKAQAEAIVRTGAIDAALDHAIVRPPAVYGPHDRDLFELFRAALWGIVPVPPVGRTSLIHVRDLARLLIALVDTPLGGRCFEPDDGVSGGWDHRDLARAIGAALDRRPRVVPISERWLERAARLDRRLRGSAARLTRDRIGYLAHPDWVVSPDAKPPATLWRARIETRAGFAATADWYRARGWL